MKTNVIDFEEAKLKLEKKAREYLRRLDIRSPRNGAVTTKREFVIKEYYYYASSNQKGDSVDNP